MPIKYELHKGVFGELLEKIFDRKDGYVKTNPGNIVMPIKYCEFGDEILKSNVRKDDVWVVSFPRSGKFIYIFLYH